MTQKTLFCGAPAKQPAEICHSAGCTLVINLALYTSKNVPFGNVLDIRFSLRLWNAEGIDSDPNQQADGCFPPQPVKIFPVLNSFG